MSRCLLRVLLTCMHREQLETFRVNYPPRSPGFCSIECKGCHKAGPHWILDARMG